MSFLTRLPLLASPGVGSLRLWLLDSLPVRYPGGRPGSQAQPGAARRSQAQQGAARRSQAARTVRRAGGLAASQRTNQGGWSLGSRVACHLAAQCDRHGGELRAVFTLDDRQAWPVPVSLGQAGTDDPSSRLVQRASEEASADFIRGMAVGLVGILGWLLCPF